MTIEESLVASAIYEHSIGSSICCPHRIQHSLDIQVSSLLESEVIELQLGISMKDSVSIVVLQHEVRSSQEILLSLVTLESLAIQPLTMSSIKAIKKSTKKTVESLISSTPDLLASFESTFSTHFTASSPSALESEYEAATTASPDAVNKTLVSALSAYKDHLAASIENIQTLERFIIVHIPQMEDGNNFGVTVQMTVAKALKEAKENLLKKMDSLLAYYNDRAGAVEKLALEKTTISKTAGTNKSESTKEDEKKEGSSSSTEEKVTSVVDKAYPFRVMHLVALDVNAYFAAKSGLTDCVNEIIMALDNVEKNMDKITSPKGSSGGSGHMGMY